MLINYELLKSSYEPDFIEKCETLRKEVVKSISDLTSFFTDPDSYALDDYKEDRKALNDAGLNYLSKLVWFPNILVLDYILQHKDEFKTLTCLDFGCGLGFLSILLDHIGISCLAHDIWVHGVHENHTKFILQQFGLEDKLVTLENCKNFQVFINMGTPGHPTDLISKAQYLIFNKVEDRPIANKSLFTLIDSYPAYKVEVWRKR